MIFAPQVALYGIGIVLAGVLQAHRSFLGAGARPAALEPRRAWPPTSPTAMRTEAASPRRRCPRPRCWVLAGGTTLGVVVLSLPLFVPAWRAGARLRPTFRFPRGRGPPGRRPRRGRNRGAARTAGRGARHAVARQQPRQPGRRQRLRLRAGRLPAAVCRARGADRDLRLPGAGPRGQGSRPAGSTAPWRARCRPSSCCAAVPPRFSSPSPAPSARSSRRSTGRRAPGEATPWPRSRRRWSPTHRAWSASALAALLTRALYVRGRPALAALAVAGGWLVAALWPFITLPDDAGAAGTLRSLGAARRSV